MSEAGAVEAWRGSLPAGVVRLPRFPPPGEVAAPLANGRSLVFVTIEPTERVVFAGFQLEQSGARLEKMRYGSERMVNGGGRGLRLSAW